MLHKRVYRCFPSFSFFYLHFPEDIYIQLWKSAFCDIRGQLRLIVNPLLPQPGGGSALSETFHHSMEPQWETRQPEHHQQPAADTFLTGWLAGWLCHMTSGGPVKATQPRRYTSSYLASGGPQQLLLLLQVLPLGRQRLLLCILLTPQVAGAEGGWGGGCYCQTDGGGGRRGEADGFLLSFTLQLILAVLHLIVLLVQLLHTALHLVQVLVQFLDINTQVFRQGGGGTRRNQEEAA